MQQNLLAVVYFFAGLCIPAEKMAVSIEYDRFASREFDILLFSTLFCHTIFPLIGRSQWAPFTMLWNGYIILPFQTLLGIESQRTATSMGIKYSQVHLQDSSLATSAPMLTKPSLK